LLLAARNGKEELHFRVGKSKSIPQSSVNFQPTYNTKLGVGLDCNHKFLLSQGADPLLMRMEQHAKRKVSILLEAKWSAASAAALRFRLRLLSGVLLLRKAEIRVRFRVCGARVGRAETRRRCLDGAKLSDDAFGSCS